MLYFLQRHWINSWSENFSGLFRKSRTCISKHFIWLCNYWHFPLVKLTLPGPKHSNWESRKFFQPVKKSTDTLMNENHRLVFEKCMILFHEWLDYSQLLAISVHNTSNAMTSSRNVSVKKYSADRSLFIETMIAEIEKVVLKLMESVY